jgi:hypothetical protein
LSVEQRSIVSEPSSQPGSASAASRAASRTEHRQRVEQRGKRSIGSGRSIIVSKPSSEPNWNIVSELSGDPSEHRQRAEGSVISRATSRAEHCQWSSKQSGAARRTEHRLRAGQTAKRSIGSESSGSERYLCLPSRPSPTPVYHHHEQSAEQSVVREPGSLLRGASSAS